MSLKRLTGVEKEKKRGQVAFGGAGDAAEEDHCYFYWSKLRGEGGREFK